MVFLEWFVDPCLGRQSKTINTAAAAAVCRGSPLLVCGGKTTNRLRKEKPRRRRQSRVYGPHRRQRRGWPDGQRTGGGGLSSRHSLWGS